MPSQANVRSIAALDEMNTALKRFESEAQSLLRSTGLEIQRTLKWLQDRLKYWQNELKRRQQQLIEAQRALQACLRSGDRDHPPDCRQQQAYVLYMQRQVQEAEQELRIVVMHMKRIDEAIRNYQVVAGRFSATLNGELLQGSAFLSNRANILNTYASAGSLPTSIGIGGNINGGGNSGGTGIAASNVPGQQVFASSKSLNGHFKKHKDEFHPLFVSSQDYAQAANSFMKGPLSPGTLEKFNRRGDIVRYNPGTEEFGVLSKFGKVRTYFILNPKKHELPTNLDYFNAQ